MAQNAQSESHALQIAAGINGRRRGHGFESDIAESINRMTLPKKVSILEGGVHRGEPGELILNSIATANGTETILQVRATATGATATAENRTEPVLIDGNAVAACKSDVVIEFQGDNGRFVSGISTKQCNNRTPTNAQLYFTTATAFVELLRRSGISVSDIALRALRQFCGDAGYQPLDSPRIMQGRLVDPRRFFWEEIDSDGRFELANVFAANQDTITELLLTKGYSNDPYPPDFLVHKTKACSKWSETELAIFSVKELVRRSRSHSGFVCRPYSVRKGAYRDPSGVTHDAPRFGVVQMQRGGQKVHPSQLQFNLKAGYFYELADL